jgi:uncharacterized membrane protein
METPSSKPFLFDCVLIDLCATMTQSVTPKDGTATAPAPAKPTANSTWQRLWSRVEIFLFVAIALSAVGIGLYGLSFLNAIVRARHFPEERPYGLLQTKPKALLADDYYIISFGLHVFFGAVSIIGWAQFVDSWRQKQPLVHRWLGRIYVGSVMISAPAVFIVGSHSTGGSITAAGFSGLALFWIASTASAVSAIRGSPRQLVGHQKAMILSYRLFPPTLHTTRRTFPSSRRVQRCVNPAVVKSAPVRCECTRVHVVRRGGGRHQAGECAAKCRSAPWTGRS